MDGFAFIEFYEVSGAVDWMNKKKVTLATCIKRGGG